MNIPTSSSPYLTLPLENPPRQYAREFYRAVRDQTDQLCLPLGVEDYGVQTMADVSPTKWHLAHTTWFFETFILKNHLPGYRPFHPLYDYLFNSYYNTLGSRIARPERGLMARPTVDEIFSYRTSIDEQMNQLLEDDNVQLDDSILPLILLGLHHEQQHQELILTDIKHVFANNPMKPRYKRGPIPSPEIIPPPLNWHGYQEGLQWIGHEGNSFSFDNEKPRHRVFVESFQLGSRLMTNGEYLEFMHDGGYEKPQLWLSDGWNARLKHGWISPLYWDWEDGNWMQFTLAGPVKLDLAEPLCHISYYEAEAFARWANARLPTEAEWELAASKLEIQGNLLENNALHPAPLAESAPLADSADPTPPQQMFGDVWEWTGSPYMPYPGYRQPNGALGEYNGKFMCNQMVLRGGSCVTPQSHIRSTYRNFFPPEARWQFTGLRLARNA